VELKRAPTERGKQAAKIKENPINNSKKYLSKAGRGGKMFKALKLKGFKLK